MSIHIGFIGFGNMAQAIAQHLIHIPAYHLSAAAPKLPIGTTSEGIRTHHDNRVVVQSSEMVILAVKPNQATSVLQQIGPILPHNTLLISIVAGFNLTRLAKHCRAHQAIIRSMPNLPIAIGRGATPLIANAQASSSQKIATEQLFQSAGITTWLEHEKDMDCLTALTGSGPAYLFYLIEAILSAGKTFGLQEDIIQPLVLQTIAGAIQMAMENKGSITELRTKVTSPGGTTAAAMAVFERKGFDGVICEAIKAAFERSQQL